MGDVRVRRLDQLLAGLDINRVDYLRMNIEGHELRALVGLGSHLERVQNLCVSCHDFLGDDDLRTFDQVTAFLASAGFDVQVSDDGNAGDAVAWYVYASRR